MSEPSALMKYGLAAPGLPSRSSTTVDVANAVLDRQVAWIVVTAGAIAALVRRLAVGVQVILGIRVDLARISLEELSLGCIGLHDSSRRSLK